MDYATVSQIMIADLGKTGKSWAHTAKHLLDFLLIPAIVILVGVACFGLGRLSALKEAHTGVVIHSASEGSSNPQQ
jgi:hypothetical protein